MGYSLRLVARILLYAPSNRHDSTYHSLFYTSHGALAGTGNNSIDRPSDEDQHITVGGWEVITTP